MRAAYEGREEQLNNRSGILSPLEFGEDKLRK